MKITFYSNYLTHHQIPFCEAMHNRLGNEYCFVSTQPMEEERKIGGWELSDQYPYELKAYESDAAYQKSLELARTSNVIIIGSAPEIYVKERMQSSNNLTFRYSERIFKNGRWRALSPRGMLIRYKTYFRYLNKPLYMLCASAYTSGDLALTGAYINRCYKWGYFPQTYIYDIDSLLKQKKTASILWVGRLIEWKHPDASIEMARKLKEDGMTFSLNIIGSGIMEEQLKAMIDEYALNDSIQMLGSLTPDEVREHMNKASIFLATSDFNEGWGAVINEAMNSGCAVVASHAMGSIPFLTSDREDGLIYRSGNTDELYHHVRFLLSDVDMCNKIGRNAYSKIENTWNAENATKRLLALTQNLLDGKPTDKLYNEGPCSKAEQLNNRWRKKG